MMKLLENIVLVQFFLYGAKDLETGLNTAFLGPNGTGKSAILDALQVVMMAADSSRTHFNAAGEGKKRARSLRDYCLGSHVPGGSSYARTSSNTYVDLVFRDTKTGIPFSAGVSLSARLEDPQAEVLGLYILPGVALTANHHLQTEGLRETVMPWREFRQVAADLCRLEAQSTPLITQNKEDFVRHLLIDHLAGPGDKPNAKSLRAAFARSLKLGEEIVDLSETLRQHLIEPMPTGVKAFRDRLDDVRKLRDLIRQLQERIERATSTIDKYEMLKRERASEVNLAVLRHTYGIERLGTTLDSAEVEIEKLAEDIDLGNLEQARAKTEVLNAASARDLVIAELNRNPDFLNQAAHAQNLSSLEAALKAKHTEIQSLLNAMLAALVDAARIPNVEVHIDSFKRTHQQVQALHHLHGEGQTPSAVAMQTALRSLSQVYEVVRIALAEAEQEQTQAAARHRDARTAAERANRGLTPLRDDTIRLIGVLANAGVDVTPVCDLVSVSDPSWQPAIESWLGRHIEALLVPAAQELDAIQIYRSKAASGIYGVKLALPSRVREWRAAGDEQYAARLIQGPNLDAVRYLQGELGRTALVETNEQLRAGTKVISKEGMASSGGGIERRRLPGVNELRIGRTDGRALRQRSEHNAQTAEELLRTTNETVRLLGVAQRKLAPFANADALQHAIEHLLTELSKTTNAAAMQKSALESTLTDSLAKLREKKEVADSRQSDAQELEKKWVAQLARLNEQLKTKRSQVGTLQQMLDAESLLERQTRQNTLYGASEVERFRTRFDNRHAENWAAKLSDLEETLRSASKAAANADRDAWALFASYVVDYDLQNHDVSGDNWLRALEFILSERHRLEELELVEQQAKAEEAYEAAVKVFRTDVAQTLLAGFDRIEEQIDGLTAVLRSAPAFTNDERYEFKHNVVDEHRSLYDFLLRIRAQGVAEDDLFGGPGETPEEFRMLVDGDTSSALLDETSPLYDHRRFFSYDIQVFQSNTSVGWLSKRFGSASGGEHRTPLYLIFGAALAAAYGKSKGSTAGGGIMLLDEAFDKMDPQNIRAAVQYLNALGLQLIMAGPESDQGKLSSFLSIYYDMARFGSKNVQLTKNVVFDGARELLQSDNFYVHPNLLQREIDRLNEAENAPS
jgi:uncharacterized protein YPO0396